MRPYAPLQGRLGARHQVEPRGARLKFPELGLMSLQILESRYPISVVIKLVIIRLPISGRDRGLPRPLQTSLYGTMLSE
jgi:hypothetical protein